MIDRIRAVRVGAPDPELRTSPIVEETDEEFDSAAQALADEPNCYFNGRAYPTDQFVCSGSELLRCARGAWVQEGSCDQDRP